MTKRADGKFERSLNDFYVTPQEAIPPLAPHIPRGATFVEPCAGDGALVHRLQTGLGLHCTGAYDIMPRAGFVRQGNALYLGQKELHGASLIVTNPPYERDAMHAIIDHLRKLRLSWFLLESDWLFTKQAGGLLAYADRIVAVGRLKLIPDSKTSGFDNYCWVRFGQTITSTRFHPRGSEC